MAATEESRLVLRIEAQLRKFERQMARASGISAKQMNAIERRAMVMQRRLDRIGHSAAQSLIAPLAGIGSALSVREIIRYSDAWKEAGNKIASAEKVAGIQARSLDDLNRIARDTRSSLSATTEVYSRTMRAAHNLGVSEREIAKITELTAKAFKAGGASTQEMHAGMIQLGQALGSAALQGDELRSIRENATLLAKAIADYMGVTVGELKRLGAEGKITSQIVSKAILSAQADIDSAFKATQFTIHDAMTQVENAFIQYIGKTDAGLGASQRLIQALLALADDFDHVADTTLKVAGIIASAFLGRAIGGMIAKVPIAASAIMNLVKALATGRAALIAFQGAAGPLGAILAAATAAIYLLNTAQETDTKATKMHEDALVGLQDKLKKVSFASDEARRSFIAQARAALTAAKADLQAAEAQAEKIRKAMGGLSAFIPIDAETQARIDKAKKDIIELHEAIQMLNGKSDKLPIRATFKPALAPKSKKSAPAKAPKMRSLDEFAQRIDAIRSETEALRFETSLLGLSADAAARAKAEHELLNAARAAGIPITKEISGLIGKLAADYGAATEEAEKLKSAQESAQQVAQMFGETAVDGILGLIEGTRSAADVMRDLVRQLARAALQAAILGNGPLAGMFGMNGRGLIGGLLGGFAAGGVFQSGDVTAFSAGGVVGRPTLFPMARGAGLMGEAGPEAIMPLARGLGGKLGVRASGGGVIVNVVNNTGAQISTHEKNGLGGRREIEVIVGRIVDDRLDRRSDDIPGLRPMTRRTS